MRNLGGLLTILVVAGIAAWFIVTQAREIEAIASKNPRRIALEDFRRPNTELELQTENTGSTSTDTQRDETLPREDGGIESINLPARTCDSIGSFHNAFLCHINEHRVNNGLNELIYSPALTAAAQAHSEWMKTEGALNHIGENGTTFDKRCVAQGTTCDAENVAIGFTSPVSLFNLWKRSTGHNANMLGNHTELGLGISGSYATTNYK